MSRFCPECGKEGCNDHNGNGIKTEFKTQKELGKYIHQELKDDIAKLDREIVHLQKHIDDKIKFVIMVSLAVFGVIGSVTLLDEVRLSSDIEDIETSVIDLTKQVTELKVISEARISNQINADDLIKLERHIMQEISQLRAEIESLK